MEKKNKRVYGSFRDPDGYLFYDDEGVLCRRINQSYKKHFDFFIQSGLFGLLRKEKKIVDFKEIKVGQVVDEKCYKIIQPRKIPFISYPYEWCFSELKDAALLTLFLQKEALKKNMTLKDASAFNVQFFEGKPVHIDTLSFEKYQEGEPWVAYKQFCQHFLAPLALMAFTDLRLNQLSKNFIDGIPLDLASSLLPFKTKLRFSLLAHIHVHAKIQKRYSDVSRISRKKISKTNILALIDNLVQCVKKISLKKSSTEWGEYYSHTNYSLEALNNKKVVVEKMIKDLRPKNLWDLGANTGMFSRLSSDLRIPTVSFDVDFNAVEENYNSIKKQKEKFLLALFLDLTNPSPDLGWAGKERASFINRGPVDMVLALALIHHLTISNNTPFGYVAEFFSKFSKYLVIEFVPKEDSKVIKLLKTRKDVFHEYTQKNFERQFKKYFSVEQKELLKSSKRILYLMKKK